MNVGVMKEKGIRVRRVIYWYDSRMPDGLLLRGNCQELRVTGNVGRSDGLFSEWFWVWLAGECGVAELVYWGGVGVWEFDTRDSCR